MSAPRKGKRSRRGPTPARGWRPLERAALVSSPAVSKLRSLLDLPDLPETWMNDRYVVVVERSERGDVEHLSVRRADRGTTHDWRDLQRIKDQVAGPDVEAVELYPARSRLVDTANQYHLWCLAPGVPFPFGYPSGLVADEGELPLQGAVQRPFEPCDLEPGGIAGDQAQRDRVAEVGAMVDQATADDEVPAP